MLEIDQRPYHHITYRKVCTSWSLGKVTRLAHSASWALHLPIQKKKDVDSHDGHLRRQRPWNATKTLWSRAFLLTLVPIGTPNSKHSELIWTRIQRASEMPKGWSLTVLISGILYIYRTYSLHDIDFQIFIASKLVFVSVPLRFCHIQDEPRCVEGIQSSFWDNLAKPSEMLSLSQRTERTVPGCQGTSRNHWFILIRVYFAGVLTDQICVLRGQLL